jgi:hypothetical protein
MPPHKPVREPVPERPDLAVLGALIRPLEPAPQRTRRVLSPRLKGIVESLFPIQGSGVLSL